MGSLDVYGHKVSLCPGTGPRNCNILGLKTNVQKNVDITLRTRMTSNLIDRVVINACLNVKKERYSTEHQFK